MESWIIGVIYSPFEIGVMLTSGLMISKQKRPELKNIVLYSIIFAMIFYPVRMLLHNFGIPFGIHTLIWLIMGILLLPIVKVKTIQGTIALVISMVLMMVMEIITSKIIGRPSDLTVKLIIAWVSLLLLITTGFIIRRIFKDEEEEC